MLSGKLGLILNLRNLRLIVKLENKTIFKTPDSIAFWLLARSIDQMQRKLSEVQRSEIMPAGLCSVQCGVCELHLKNLKKYPLIHIFI